MLRLALTFALILVAFDAIAATIARIGQFNYGHFALLAVLIYVAFGFYAGRTLLWRGLASIVVAALIDASLGTYVASLIGPGRPSSSASTVEIVWAGVFAVAVAVIWGAVGVFFGVRQARATRST